MKKMTSATTGKAVATKKVATAKKPTATPTIDQTELEEFMKSDLPVEAPVADPRIKLVKCSACGHEATKSTMTSLADRWFCVEVDECRSRRGLTQDTTPEPKAASSKTRAPKAVKQPKPAKAPLKNNRASNTHFALDMVITLLVDKNPKREGSTGHAHFALYFSGQTVGQALASGITRADLLWDTNHSFISVA